MELSEATMWGIVIALVSIPLCYYFWRRWDRPSRAAKLEQDRRLKERETRKAFQHEEEKAREHERQQALVQLQERKKISILAPSTEAISFALSNLDVAGISNNRVEESSLEKTPESFAVPDIEPDESVTEILEDEGLVYLKVGIILPEEVKSDTEPVSLDTDFEWPEWE